MKPFNANTTNSHDWNDVRFLLRATAAAMRSHDALEESDYRRAEALARDADTLPDGEKPRSSSLGAGARGRRVRHARQR